MNILNILCKGEQKQTVLKLESTIPCFRKPTSKAKPTTNWESKNRDNPTMLSEVLKKSGRKSTNSQLREFQGENISIDTYINNQGGFLGLGKLSSRYTACCTFLRSRIWTLRTDEKFGMLACTCNPSSGGNKDKRILEMYCLAFVAQMVNFKFSKTLTQNVRLKRY